MTKQKLCYLIGLGFTVWMVMRTGSDLRHVNGGTEGDRARFNLYGMAAVAACVVVTRKDSAKG